MPLTCVLTRTSQATLTVLIPSLRTDGSDSLARRKIVAKIGQQRRRGLLAIDVTESRIRCQGVM